MILLRTKLHFGSPEMCAYMLGNGFSVICGGAACKLSIERFGQVGHTHLAVASATASMLLWAKARRPWHVGMAQLVDILGVTAGHGLSSMLTTVAVSQGMGRAEIQASLQNQATLTKVIAPLAYANLFSRFGQLAPFVLAATLFAAVELTLRSPAGCRAIGRAKAAGRAGRRPRPTPSARPKAATSPGFRENSGGQRQRASQRGTAGQA